MVMQKEIKSPQAVFMIKQNGKTEDLVHVTCAWDSCSVFVDLYRHILNNADDGLYLVIEPLRVIQKEF